MDLGQRIKGLRGSVRQREFARRCKIDASTINKIEKGSLIGTLDIHIKICQALGISLSTLYKGVYEEKIHPLEVTLEKPLTLDKKISRHILAWNVLLNKRMLPEILILEEEKQLQENLPPDTQRFIYVLEGKVEIGTKNEKHTLSHDQSLYVTDASIQHTLRNTGLSPATILVVTNPIVL